MIDIVKNTHYNVFKFLSKKEMQWQGGVHSPPKQREEMDGENLREEAMEVAFEQWTERHDASVGFNVFPALQGNGIGDDPVPAESREYSLNLGGNTDERFALSMWCA